MNQIDYQCLVNMPDGISGGCMSKLSCGENKIAKVA